MIKPYPIKSLLCLLLVLACNNLFAQTDLQKAWKAFYANNRAESRTLFTEAAKQNQSVGEALLGLSLLAQLDKPASESFDYFTKFCAQTKNAQPYIYALWTTASVNDGSGKKTPQQLQFFKEIAAGHQYDGMLPAMASQMIGKHYESGKMYDKADAEYKNMGPIDNWQITGEFENISTSGFDKKYDDILAHPEASAIFTSKQGTKIGWREVTAPRHDHWLDFEFYNNAHNTIVFAQNFVKADEDQTVQLRIGVSGSVKVWVNDALVLSEADERNNDLDTYIQHVKLNKGYNRILVQLGESYCNNLNFMVRLTDDKGYVLHNLAYTAQPQPYTKAGAYNLAAVQPVGITFFADKIKQDPDDDLSKILLAEAYLRNDRTFEARRLVDDLKKKYPDNTFLNTMLLQIFAREDNRTGTETTKEAIKNADPHAEQALMYKYTELFTQKEFDKATGVIKELEANYPDQQEFIYSAKIGLAGSNKNQDEVVRLGEEAYLKFPDNRDLVQLKYAIEKELHKNVPAAIAVLKKYADTNDDYGMTKILAEAYFTAGNADLGYKVLQDEIANKPYATGIYSYIGNHYYDQQQYAKSEENYLKTIQIAPTVSTYYASLGKINEMSNHKDQSVSYYQKDLQLNPNDYETIKALRKLQSKKDVFSYFTEPDIDAIIKAAPKAADYPDDNSVILNEEEQKVVYEQGGSETRKFLTVKILTQKGIESWKQYNIDTDSWQNLVVEAAEVIKVNGSKVPAERNEGTLVFTNLEVGDVVNMRYKVQNYEKGRLAGYFWDSFYFTHGKPYVTTKYSLLISKNQKFTSTFSLKAITPVKTSADEFDLYVWQNSKQASLQYEDKMPPIDDIANVLYLTSIPNWKFVSDWYNDMATAKARTNYEVKQVISDLFTSKPNLTQMQKVEKIYNYITSNISYSSVSFRQSGLIPQNPSTVINTRIGDCKDVATLFVAMCKEAGIKAHLVLVKTRDNGLLTMPLPSIDFNHCMAKVNLDNQDYYIELTSQYLPFRCLYSSSLNSTLLDINDESVPVDAISYLHPATRKQNNVKRNTSILLNAKNMVITEKTVETGSMAGGLRESYGELSQKDRIKRLKEAISSTYPDVEITNLVYKNIERLNPTDTVYVNLSYQLSNVTKAIGGMSIFNLPWSSKISANDLQVSMPRTSGIDLSQMFFLDNDVESITINLPPGKKMVESITPVILSSDIIEYSIVPKQLGNKLILTRTFKLKKDFVPVDKVAQFNTFFKKMVEADNKELAMR
ncbi:transglutaminase domain-containing protein [Mucilaginibacter polytrichastri]|uniref:Transglutaminase-like domain-containing protein n=1 Tax=Mucilaginibacter polytrichastri TaxID=1302689 RepID=A0A1Q6A519_9SPHI|nr:transglutaminase domain-containing protein [Mucilaginibacter polytrichastri]OKS89092.1 hypothetical protein RG47T_4573 [Mucilaginibacter polytrichastri]SFS96406.1 protein of unknown function [Mucilaginibacter polytrichastri]